MGPDSLIISDFDLNNVIKTSYTPYPNFSLLKTLLSFTLSGRTCDKESTGFKKSFTSFKKFDNLSSLLLWIFSKNISNFNALQIISLLSFPNDAQNTHHVVTLSLLVELFILLSPSKLH